MKKTIHIATNLIISLNTKIAKRLMFLLLLSSISAEILFAQITLDVIYLKNGSIIKGTIAEQVLGESLKIKTRDGNILVFSEKEIQKITKEIIRPSEPLENSGLISTKPTTSPAALYQTPTKIYPTQLAFGYGNSFGGFGLAIQGDVSESVALHAGGGYFPMSTIEKGAKDMFMVSGGMKVFFSPRQENTRFYLDLQFGMLGGEYHKTTIYSGFSTSTTEEQQALYGPSALLGGQLFFGGGQIGLVFAGGASYNLADVKWMDIKLLGALDLGLIYRF